MYLSLSYTILTSTNLYLNRPQTPLQTPLHPLNIPQLRHNPNIPIRPHNRHSTLLRINTKNPIDIFLLIPVVKLHFRVLFQLTGHVSPGEVAG